jgi:hypothetical protein
MIANFAALQTHRSQLFPQEFAMSLSISGGNAAVPIAPIAVRPVLPSSARQDTAQIGKALKNGDLSAAQSAYADLLKQAPAGSSLTPGSPLAELGKALKQGDLSAAKSAYSDLLQSRAQGGAGTVKPVPVTPPAQTSASGSAGAVINTVA